MNKAIIFVLLAMVPLPASAYIGPGMAGGVIAATVGFLAAIFLALWGILYFPIKRALKNKRRKKMESTQSKPNLK